jgi:hypothetical protein
LILIVCQFILFGSIGQLESIQLTLNDVNLGFDTNGKLSICLTKIIMKILNKTCYLDKVLNEAAKILRLLHIKELRTFQTKINQTIVSIQNITANPKTDSSLGKVGK